MDIIYDVSLSRTQEYKLDLEVQQYKHKKEMHEKRKEN